MNLDRILDRIHPLPLTSKTSLLKCIREVHYPKGHILMKSNKIEHNIYIINKGIVRAYSHREGNEVTFWFGMEGDPVVSMKSYVQNQPGYEDIELLEDCELYEITTKHLHQLYNEDIHLTNWGRKFAEVELIKSEERLISLQFHNATERYNNLLKNHPDLLQRVALGHLASYLGITQVSLSRIRAAHQ